MISAKIAFQREKILTEKNLAVFVNMVNHEIVLQLQTKKGGAAA
jgi:hypothetical protein